MNALGSLFWVFFKISLFSIGGGYNMIPLMQHEVVAHAWLIAERFLDVLAVSEITPGPVAVNLATFAGYQVAGIPGALFAVPLAAFANVVGVYLSRRAWETGDSPLPEDLIWSTVPRSRRTPE